MNRLVLFLIGQDRCRQFSLPCILGNGTVQRRQRLHDPAGACLPRARSFFDQLALDRLDPILDLDGQTTRRYGVVGLPVTFFIDGQGVIRHVERGEVMDANVIRDGIAKAR